MRHVERGGRYLRVADPGWDDPLSGEYARETGGRWNPPGEFEVVYLNADLQVARAQVRHSLEPRGIRPEDLDPHRGPVLVHYFARGEELTMEAEEEFSDWFWR